MILPTTYSNYVKNKSLVHFTSPDWFHLAKYNKNSYGTIHDFFPLTWSDTNPRYNIYFINELNYVNKLRKVVVISDYIKKQANELYPNAQIERIHNWTDDSYKPRDKDEARKKLGLPLDKIILLNVSTDQSRKNIKILPKIMNKLDDQFLLIRIGKSEKILKDFKKNNYIIYNYVKKDELPLYYNAADMLLAPSFDEGFDFPIIEAINSGINVVASNIPVHKEIMFGHNYLVDPNDVEEWVNAIIKASYNKPEWSDLADYYKKERALKEYKKFYEI